MAIHTASPRRPSLNTRGQPPRVLLELPARRSGVSAERRHFSLPPKTVQSAENITDVPVLTPLGWLVMQKSPISRILPHNPASSRLLPPGEGGIKC
jgi:hypothetical protein